MPLIGRSAPTSTPPSASTIPTTARTNANHGRRPGSRVANRSDSNGDEDRVDVDDHAGQRGGDRLDPRVVRPGIPRVDRSERQGHRELPA